MTDATPSTPDQGSSPKATHNVLGASHSGRKADGHGNDAGLPLGAHRQQSLRRMQARHARRMMLPAQHSATRNRAGMVRTVVEVPEASEGKAAVTCIDYSPEDYQQQDHLEVKLDQFLAEHRPEWSQVRWIDLNGVHDHAAVLALARKYDLHPLAIDDVLHIPQRPKIDQYTDEDGHPPRLFIILRVPRLVDGRLQTEQLSIFLGRRTVLTFREGLPGDPWAPIRQRLEMQDSRLRHNDASFLLYALMEAIIDEVFPILDNFGDRLEQLEEEILTNVRRDSMFRVHEIRRELLLMQRQMRPMREVIHSLTRESHPCLSEETRLYLRDVYDHVIQCVEFLETYHELSMNLADMVNSNIANRVNDVMKVLTVIATIFIPISFLASLFGMNFNEMPGRNWPPAFTVFCVACVAMAATMLLYFKRKDWL